MLSSKQKIEEVMKLRNALDEAYKNNPDGFYEEAEKLHTDFNSIMKQDDFERKLFKHLVKTKGNAEATEIMKRNYGDSVME